MGTNALGQTTIPVIAARRISYHERLVVAGERFECEEVQARAFLKTGAVTLARPSFKSPSPPPPPLEPVIAKVIAAEKVATPPAEPVKPVEESKPPVEDKVETANPDESSTKVEPMSMPTTDAPLATHRARYDRRDMRSK